MINKNIADEIALQALKEIEIARLYKQGKIRNWTDNEKMYYGDKSQASSDGETRANVSLGQMQEFVHTLLSKIDNPLTFKFTKRKNSQLKRVQYLNAMKVVDADEGFWDLKDLVGKKQAIIYGRAVYAYYASSEEGYQSNLDPIDVYDFLIDPSTNGFDIETAMFMGNWGVVKTLEQLKAGVKNKLYHAKQVSELINNNETGNSTDLNQEETNKRSRSYDVSTVGQKETPNPNKFKFWQWITTYQSVRYYILMDNSGRWIRCEELKKLFESNIYPYWTYATFPDMTEFWTPSYCDYARQIFMAQEVSINQMLDNSEAINKPQKIVQVGAIEDMASVKKYKKSGIIPVKKGTDARAAIQFVETPSINTPMLVYDKLQSIQDRASGVGANEAGAADENGKVGIYEGNQVASADRFGLLNKSYSFGYKRFAKLYEWGIKEHLNNKVAVDILGPDGVEIKKIRNKDIYKKGDVFGCLVEASNAEVTNSLTNQKTKLTFLSGQVQNPMVNKSKAFEMEAKIAGFTEDEIRELLDINSYGNEELMSEADRDIEMLLNKEIIEPNEMANNAYKQKMINYLRDHKEDITFEQFGLIAEYITTLEPIIMRNEARNLQNELTDKLKNNASLPVGPDGQPIVTPTQPQKPTNYGV